MSTSASTSSSPAKPAEPPFVATPQTPAIAVAGRYYRNARYLMVVLTLGFAVYFLYDGYYAYPAENDAYAAKPENQDKDGKFIGKMPHSNTDLMTQKALGFGLIPAGLAYFAFFMHRSRGAYRFDGTTIQMPGHPPFTLSEVTKLDKKLWDRKGIAYVEYMTAAGKVGKATIDDFIYERKPADVIYDAIVLELKNRVVPEKTE